MHESVPTVTRLSIAPVKALAAQHPESVRLDADGVAEDRRLFLLDGSGAVVTQRRFPQLAGVGADLDLDARWLEVTPPGSGPVGQALEASGEPVRARLFGKPRSGRVVPGPVAAALSAYAGQELRLVLADRTGVGWDEGPVSLVGAASVAAVGTPATPGGPAADRFRMLVETDGDRPFVEDAWVGARLTIGTAVVAVTHELGRCVVIDHDPATGAADWTGVKALTRLRGRPTLGVIGEVVTPGTISRGDPVRVEPEA